SRGRLQTEANHAAGIIGQHDRVTIQNCRGQPGPWPVAIELGYIWFSARAARDRVDKVDPPIDPGDQDSVSTNDGIGRGGGGKRRLQPSAGLVHVLSPENIRAETGGNHQEPLTGPIEAETPA